MRADLQELEINKGELKRLTGDKNYIDSSFAYIPCLSIVLVLIIFAFATLFDGEIAKAGGTLIFIVPSILVTFLMYKTRPKLAKEVNQYNQLIKDINTLDQLEAAGNPVTLNEREKVIEAVRLSRANLVRALETERILKENPQFRPDRFNIDLTGLRTLQATEKATEYGRFLDEALQIGVSVQDEMRKIEQKRLK